jgi:N,N'-diacetylchitobiose transport system permease protein
VSPGSATAPPDSAVAAEPLPAARRHGRLGRRAAGGLVPYALLAPTAAVVGLVLAYPVYLLFKLSFQQYDLPQLLQQKGVWIGLDNYRTLVDDPQFRTVLVRTIVFTFVNVGLTMLFGTLIALLLVKLGRKMRLLLTTGLVLVWSMPVVVAVNVFYWMVDYEFGVLNWTLTELGVGNFIHHDWFENSLSGFAIITALIVWGAIPFVAITLYAGLSQVPAELVEAASIDGANGLRTFRDITFPILKPIFLILTSLSIIWDFQVFNQVWIMRAGRPEEDYYLMSIYSYVTSFGVSQYGLGSAIAVTMVLIMFAVTFVYTRQMIRTGSGAAPADVRGIAH